MLKPIQVGAEVVIFLNDRNKSIVILDPKTGAAIKQYNNDHTEISTNIVYSQKYEQILASETQKTMVQVWTTDTDKPVSKISVEAINAFAFDESQSFLIGGSKSGNIFIWEVPTGTLLRKFPAHSEEIIKVSVDENMYITSATRTSIRSWKLINIFNSEPEVKHSREITTKERIIDLIDTVDKYFVLTGSHVLGFIKLTGEKSEIIQVQSATCFAINKQSTHLFVGSSNKTITEFRINFIKEYREITVDKQDGVKLEKTPQKRNYPRHHQAEITSICYIDSLKYVVSGSANGEILTWSRGELKDRKTFKPEISLLKCIDRPVFKDLRLKKKITTLHRYEVSQTNPEEKILEYIGEKPDFEEDKSKEFAEILTMVNNNEYQQEIERLKSRNVKLNESLSHYTRLFIEKFD